MTSQDPKLYLSFRKKREGGGEFPKQEGLCDCSQCSLTSEEQGLENLATGDDPKTMEPKSQDGMFSECKMLDSKDMP